jgi:L-arabinose isomerase
MEAGRPKVGVVMTLLELYRTAHPEVPGKLGSLWRGILEGMLSETANLHFTDVAHTAREVASAVASCEKADCDLLMVLPLAYAASGSAVDVLCAARLPLLLISSARDATLPYGMTDDHIMADHAVHGVQDLANVLARAGREFELIAGHPSDATFRRKLLCRVRAAAGTRILQSGRVGRIGEPFAGMFDFRFDPRLQADALGFHIVEIHPKELVEAAAKVSPAAVAEFVQWARTEFELDPALRAEVPAGTVDEPAAEAGELAASARWSLALEDIVASGHLDAVSLNFLAVGSRIGKTGTMPFLGASRLMGRGVGYAGEGDVLTAALVAAVARLAAGQATFTEMFCPDYARSEVLLSHMGECNLALANPAQRARLVAKDFPYADCARPVVPVFQLRPGEVTLASLTEWPQTGFRIVAVRGEVIAAPEHANLKSPYARIQFGRELAGLLEDYSRAGGTHHLALAYGDLREELRVVARFCQIGFEAV